MNRAAVWPSSSSEGKIRKKSFDCRLMPGTDAVGDKQTTPRSSSTPMRARASALVAPPITILTPRSLDSLSSSLTARSGSDWVSTQMTSKPAGNPSRSRASLIASRTPLSMDSP